MSTGYFKRLLLIKHTSVLISKWNVIHGDLHLSLGMTFIVQQVFFYQQGCSAIINYISVMLCRMPVFTVKKKHFFFCSFSVEKLYSRFVIPWLCHLFFKFNTYLDKKMVIRKIMLIFGFQNWL